jgi:hypothetical protein
MSCSGVTELGQDTMDNIVVREPRTSMEEARLRASVRVRIQEQFEVESTKPDRVVLLRLPDDSLSEVPERRYEPSASCW